MLENPPLISVITVAYNAAALIEQSIKSVLSQSYINFEYIIIDGGSTDDTVDVIKKYENRLSYWITEQDNGIYDAMNKGIKKAQGLFTIFVNCGDYLYDDDVFKNVAANIVNPAEQDLIYGRSKIIDNYGNITDLHIYHQLNELWKGPTFRHGALFTKTALLKEHNFELSNELKIAADFDFIYKMFKNGYRFMEIDVIVVAFLAEGASDNPYKHIEDCIYIVKKYNDWNNQTRSFYLKKHIKTALSRSILRKVNKFFRLFFKDYFANYWINKIPFYAIRHFYYRKILKISIGKGSSIHLDCFIYGNHIFIADNSTINRKCFLDGRGNLIIGNNVSISPEVHLITEDHDYNSRNFSGRSRDIVIEDYVWIGVRAIILPGVKIGKGAVICAGAVVTKNVSPFDVVAGIPAVKIKERKRDLNYSPCWMPFFD